VAAAAVVPRSAAKSPGTFAADGDLGHLEDGIAALAHDFRSLILISLSFKLVSDQFLIGSGVAGAAAPAGVARAELD
jgi:hypothetical protein